MEAEINSLREATVAAEEAAVHASKEAASETQELETLRSRLAEAQASEKAKSDLLEAQGEELSHLHHESTLHEQKVAEVRQKEAAASTLAQEATDRASTEEKRRGETETRAEELAQQHAARETEYKSRVDTMRERMSLFEDTIKELQAESFEASLEGNLGQEMAGIAEVEAAVAAAAAEVEQKDKEIATLHARWDLHAAAIYMCVA